MKDSLQNASYPRYVDSHKDKAKDLEHGVYNVSNTDVNTSVNNACAVGAKSKSRNHLHSFIRVL